MFVLSMTICEGPTHWAGQAWFRRSAAGMSPAAAGRFSWRYAMSLNHYVTLGRSGLKVSPVCLGAMTFGQEWGFGADEATAVRLMDRFIERGGNFIDTANIYT